jgi:pimeloyl-ACP methyl ester carboxylesterase
MRLDLRGHGRSTHTPGQYRLLDYGGDVVGVLRELGTPAVLVGHSLGGVIAWWVAQNHPASVIAGFLEDPPLFAAEPSPEHLERSQRIFAAMLENVRRNRAAGLSDEQLAELMGAAPSASRRGSLVSEIAMDDAVAAMAFGHNRLDEGVLEAAIDRSTLADTDVRSAVNRPIVILAADDTFGAAFSSAEEKLFAEAHPDIEVIRVTGCGHGIHDDRRHRETFVQHLCNFLDRYAPRTRGARQT